MIEPEKIPSAETVLNLFRAGNDTAQIARLLFGPEPDGEATVYNILARARDGEHRRAVQRARYERDYAAVRWVTYRGRATA